MDLFIGQALHHTGHLQLPPIQVAGCGVHVILLHRGATQIMRGGGGVLPKKNIFGGK